MKLVKDAKHEVNLKFHIKSLELKKLCYVSNILKKLTKKIQGGGGGEEAI